MVATITTNKIFSGKIYAKDNPNSCVVDVENDIQFSISMTYNDIGCDVKREGLGVYTNQVMIKDIVLHSNHGHNLLPGHHPAP